MSTNNKSTIISIKFLHSEYTILHEYAQIKNISISKLLISIVNDYLALRPFDVDNIVVKSIKKNRKFKKIVKNEQEMKMHENKKGAISLQSISIRLKKKSLEQWDNYRKARFFSRTTLVRQALNKYFNQIDTSIIFEGIEADRLNKILYCLIRGIGSIDFQKLIDIFDKRIDPSILMQALNRLEEQGAITRKGWDNYGKILNSVDNQGNIVRKGWDNYVPSNPMNYSSGSLLLGEILTRVI